MNKTLKILMLASAVALGGETISAASANAVAPDSAVSATKARRFTIGGYGEATYTRMFYSNNYKRYTNASLYRDAPSVGQFDLPHVTLNLGYDFGHGWKMGMEIEFEHGGT